MKQRLVVIQAVPLLPVLMTVRLVTGQQPMVQTLVVELDLKKEL